MRLKTPLGFAVALLGAASAHAGRPPDLARVHGSTLTDAALAGFERGRTVWLNTCELCHNEPATGAPQLGDSTAWAPRAAQGRATLYQHALEGFMGPLGDEMPARGANPDLSDDDVKAAVDYMLEAARPAPK